MGLKCCKIVISGNSQLVQSLFVNHAEMPKQTDAIIRHIMHFVRCVILAIACCVFVHAQLHDFEIIQTLPLYKAANGVEGTLQILTDSRLSKV